eukprot:1751743-Rhodomonas_salina.1
MLNAREKDGEQSEGKEERTKETGKKGKERGKEREERTRARMQGTQATLLALSCSTICLISSSCLHAPAHQHVSPDHRVCLTSATAHATPSGSTLGHLVPAAQTSHGRCQYRTAHSRRVAR